MSETKTRALLPPEDPKPTTTTNPPPANNQLSSADDDEGYITQPPANNNNPPPAQQQQQKPPASANDDEEGYVKQPVSKPPQTVDDDDEGYVKQPAANNNTTTTTTTTTTTNNNNTTANTNAPGPVATQPSATGTGITKPADEWQTKMLYDEAVDGKECAWGFFCFQCAQAKAKSDLDGSHVLYNCCCWHPGMTYSWLRSHSVYGIKSNCGSDMMSTIFCSCCAGRRITSEVRIRGPRPSKEPENGAWKEDIFGCSTCGFIQACFFPCCQAHEVRMFLQESDEHDCCYDCLCFSPCAMYGQVRHQYKLPAQFAPPLVEDICVACILAPCALNQAVREARQRKGA